VSRDSAVVKQALRRAKQGYTSLRIHARRLTASRRALPSFLIIGAQKSGTTSLFEYLSEHPRVAPPLRKEVHYFDSNFSRGEEWYRAFFPVLPRGQGSITGEATPYYLFHPLVPTRAAALMPDARLIVLLRDPVSRAFSHYQHAVRKGMESRSFADAVTDELRVIGAEHDRLLADPTYQSPVHQHRSFVTRGQYVEQLERWSAAYQRSQMLILESERLFSDAAGTYAQVLDFLTLPAHRPSRFDAANKHTYASKLTPEMRERLETHFRPYNERLAAWLGRPLAW